MTLKCRVFLLDVSEVQFEVKKKDKGAVLMQRVFRHLNLVEEDYFGLIVKGTDLQKVWLDSEKKIKNQISNLQSIIGCSSDQSTARAIIPRSGKLEFQFAVKYYPTTPTNLKEDITRYQLCLQLRKDLATDLSCSLDDLADILSYWLQSEYQGSEDNAQTVKDCLKEFESLPSEVSTKEFTDKVLSLYRKRRDMSSAEADVQFLLKTSGLAMYGIHFFEGKNTAGAKIRVGIGAKGVIEKLGNRSTISHPWNRIKNVVYKDNKFKIKLLRPPSNGDPRLKKSFIFDSEKQVYLIWRNAVDHHVFFRIGEKEKKPKPTAGSGKKPNCHWEMDGTASGGSSTLLLTETILEEDEDQDAHIALPSPRKRVPPVSYARLKSDDDSHDFAPLQTSNEMMQQIQHAGSLLETDLDAEVVLSPKPLEEPGSLREKEFEFERCKTQKEEIRYGKRTVLIEDTKTEEQYTEYWEEIEIEPTSPHHKHEVLDVSTRTPQKDTIVKSPEEINTKTGDVSDNSSTASSHEGEVHFNAQGYVQMPPISEVKPSETEEAPLPVFDDLHKNETSPLQVEYSIDQTKFNYEEESKDKYGIETALSDEEMHTMSGYNERFLQIEEQLPDNGETTNLVPEIQEVPYAAASTTAATIGDDDELSLNELDDEILYEEERSRSPEERGGFSYEETEKIEDVNVRNRSEINPHEVRKGKHEAIAFKSTLDEIPVSPRRRENLSRRPFIPSWPFDPASLLNSRDLEDLDKEAILAAMEAQKELADEDRRIEEMEMMEDVELSSPEIPDSKYYSAPPGDSHLPNYRDCFPPSISSRDNSPSSDKEKGESYQRLDHARPLIKSDIIEQCEEKFDLVSKIKIRSRSPSASPRMVGEEFIPGIPDFAQSVIPYQLESTESIENTQEVSETAMPQYVEEEIDPESLKFPKPILKFSAPEEKKECLKYRYSPPAGEKQNQDDQSLSTSEASVESGTDETQSITIISQPLRENMQAPAADMQTSQHVTSSGRSTPQSATGGNSSQSEGSSSKSSSSSFPRFIHSVFPLRRSSSNAKPRGRSKTRKKHENKVTKQKNKKKPRSKSKDKKSNQSKILPTIQVTSPSSPDGLLAFPSPPHYKALPYQQQTNSLSPETAQTQLHCQYDQESLDKIVLSESDDAHSDSDAPVTARKIEK
uniref:LOW QUALITY PROTEIN: uncharacterized protein LOC120341755 n=1 Tax=Styela clava TaxID=7725 RepID=UPI00193A8CAD|nr:LOW QUALITY PROTEIN: uncharacterized protein LOC120341755 [Styela clava]